jgi:hypothetical protein
LDQNDPSLESVPLGNCVRHRVIRPLLFSGQPGSALDRGRDSAV